MAKEKTLFGQWTYIYDNGIRRFLVGAGRNYAPHVLAMWRAEASVLTKGGKTLLSIVEECEVELASGNALSVGELVLGGGEIMASLEIAPGPTVGQILEELFSKVVEEPSLNTKESLKALLPKVYEKVKG